MGLFGKLFSKKTDPELERFAKSIEDELAEIRRPKGPQSFAKSVRKGAESRRWLFKLLKDFETETGRSGVSIVDTVETRGCMFFDQQLFEWFRKQWNSSDSEQFLYTLLALAFVAPDERRKNNEYWPSVVTTYHGTPNTEEILQEKAEKLANYIICNLGVATNLYSSFVEVSPDEFKDCHKIDDKLEELVMLEESALWLRTIDELAYMLIRAQHELFMDYLDDAFGYFLALRGAPPDAARIIAERLTQYSSYHKLLPEPGESWAGTALRAAGKHLMEAFGFGPHATFQVQFERCFLANVQGVAELLSGSRPNNTPHSWNSWFEVASSLVSAPGPKQIPGGLPLPISGKSMLKIVSPTGYDILLKAGEKYVETLPSLVDKSEIERANEVVRFVKMMRRAWDEGQLQTIHMCDTFTEDDRKEIIRQEGKPSNCKYANPFIAFTYGNLYLKQQIDQLELLNKYKNHWSFRSNS